MKGADFRYLISKKLIKKAIALYVIINNNSVIIKPKSLQIFADVSVYKKENSHDNVSKLERKQEVGTFMTTDESISLNFGLKLQ